MDGLRVYRGLLANKPLTRLLLGEFVSGIGDWLYIVAIFVVIYRESGDAALLGAFGAVRLLPYVILSVPAGFVADRFERRMVLLVSDLVRGSIMVILAILTATHAPTLLIAGFAIAAAGGSTFFYPAMGAYLPSLARDERELGPANGAWQTLGNISFIIGPAIGGLLLVIGDVTTAFVLNAFTFAFVAVILWRLPRSSRASRAADAAVAARPEETERSVATDSPEASPSDLPSETAPLETTPGPRVKLRPLAGLTLIELVAGFLDGGFQVITVIFAIEILKAGEQANGYLNTAIGIGGLLGGIGGGALVLRRSLRVPLYLGAVITGIGTIALGTATNLPFALVAIGVATGGALMTKVMTDTLWQRLVPNELLGRGLGILVAVSTLTGAAGAFLLPVLLTNAGPFESLTATGVVAIALAAAGAYLVGPSSVRKPTPHEAVLEHIATLDLFTGVPRARLQAAMPKLTTVPMVAGESAVRQGEPADRFYIIESGTFTVTQVKEPGGAPIFLRTLGPDAVF
ncbi:MAG: MFS transporter, partial [Chloroflexota bacterium]